MCSCSVHEPMVLDGAGSPARVVLLRLPPQLRGVVARRLSVLAELSPPGVLTVSEVAVVGSGVTARVAAPPGPDLVAWSCPCPRLAPREVESLVADLAATLAWLASRGVRPGPFGARAVVLDGVGRALLDPLRIAAVDAGGLTSREDVAACCEVASLLACVATVARPASDHDAAVESELTRVLDDAALRGVGTGGCAHPASMAGVLARAARHAVARREALPRSLPDPLGDAADAVRRCQVLAAERELSPTGGRRRRPAWGRRI